MVRRKPEVPESRPGGFTRGRPRPESLPPPTTWPPSCSHQRARARTACFSVCCLARRAMSRPLRAATSCTVTSSSVAPPRRRRGGRISSRSAVASARRLREVGRRQAAQCRSHHRRASARSTSHSCPSGAASCRHCCRAGPDRPGRQGGASLAASLATADCGSTDRGSRPAQRASTQHASTSQQKADKESRRAPVSSESGLSVCWTLLAVLRAARAGKF